MKNPFENIYHRLNYKGYIEMAISTNSIIHYTNAFRALSTIIKEEFRLKYCLLAVLYGCLVRYPFEQNMFD